MEIEIDPKDNFLIDASNTMYPARLRVIRQSRRLVKTPHGTIYGIVLRGTRRIRSGLLQAELPHGGFFSCVSEVEIEGSGVVILFERLGFVGIPTLGISEAQGRLSYIDGCSCSVLVVPPRCGDPVLNLLHFPAGVLQTEHVHPSIRFGAVISGNGIAFATNSNGSKKWETSLPTGSVFYLPAMERHAFQTLNQKEPLNIISFHPDSDWGPTDEVNPMLTRTYRMAK